VGWDSVPIAYRSRTAALTGNFSLKLEAVMAMNA